VLISGKGFTSKTNGLFFMLKKTFLIIWFFTNLALLAQNNELTKQIDEILSDDFFESTNIAIDVYDLTANKTVYRKNEKLLMHPASNMKILTSVAALLSLDSSFTFNTSVYYSGLLMESVCYGDLYFVGGCDPDFTSDDLDSLVKSIKEFGINEIRGNLYGDVSLLDSLFWGNGWMWDDDPSTDFPYMTPLIINDAAVKISYEPNLIDKPVVVKTIPQSKFFDIENTSVTIKEDTSDLTITRDWINRENTIIVKGTLSYKALPDTTELNLVHPEKYFLTLAEESLKKNGIIFDGFVDTATMPLFTHHIATFEKSLDSVLVNLNKESDNLSAEMLLRAMAYTYFGKPATAENGLKLIDSLVNMTGLDPTGYKFADGSGVSRYNLVTAELLLEVLKYIYYNHHDKYVKLYNSFPIAGVDGTLENRMTNSTSSGNVHAKTGSLSGVSSLSGYLTTKNNHQIAFSILMQNYIESSSVPRLIQDKICDILTSSIIE